VIASELGVAEGTIWSRLGRARRLLQERLVQRGVTLPAALILLSVAAGGADAGPAGTLVSATVKAAVASAAGGSLTGVVAARVAALVQGVSAMTAQAKLTATALLL